MPKYLIGVDLGTSGTKTVLFGTDGAALASVTVEYPLYQPKNGWAEQEPDDWWRAAADGIRGCLAESGVSPDDIAGLGISGQMHGLVLTDESGTPLRRAILWCDARTGAQCGEITELVGKKRLIEISANPALAGFTAPKILWVRENEPEIYSRARHILLPKDYVRLKLTGEYASEMSDAAGTNLLDVPRREWSAEICEKLSIDMSLLPKLYESSDAAGKVTREAAELTGLREGTVVAAGAGDNAAAAVGTGTVSDGQAFVTIGTSGVVFSHSPVVRIDPAGRVHTFCSAVPGEYTVMSCSLASGLSLQWLRNNFFAQERETAAGMGVDPYYLMDREAARIPIGAERLIYLPYLMGERSPILDPDARGAFIGLSAMHTKQHMLRAVMEGVVYSLRSCVDVMREMGVMPSALLACGGGGTSSLWRQMVADVFGCPIATVANREGPALGACVLAGVASGIYTDVRSACRSIIRENDPQSPIAENSAEYEKYYGVYKSLYPALRGSFAALAGIGG